MSGKVMVIGLDAGDPVLLEKWMSAGKLPNLARLRAGGAYARLKNEVTVDGKRVEAFSTEPLWVDFATGCKPTKTGAWDSMEYLPQTYAVHCLEEGSPAFESFAPFYALGAACRVAVLDVPMVRLVEGVDGVQILGWGGHFPHTVSASVPPALMDEVIRRHGANPILRQDKGMWWNHDYQRWLQEALAQSIERRTSLCLDLLAREDWDLFLAVYSESHSVGHDSYCFSQPDHPLHGSVDSPVPGQDPVLATYQGIDRAIGELVARMPEDGHFVCFSLHGMGPNYSDLLSGLVLPEVLYRMNFPGQTCLARGEPGTTVGPPIARSRRNSWGNEIFTRYTSGPALERFVRSWLPGRLLKDDYRGLASPVSDESSSRPMYWHPAMWYRRFWPRMRAFALPGFTKGRIRLNVRGRDPSGTVAPGDYDSVCAEIERCLYRLQDGRTGHAVVKDVTRTRRSALDDDPTHPGFDLDVLWHEHPTDVVDSPDVGRIGPLLHYRAGGHWNRGFVLASGPGIAPGSCWRTAEAVDLAPTILQLLGRAVPGHYDGRSLLPDGAITNAATHRPARAAC